MCDSLTLEIEIMCLIITSACIRKWGGKRRKRKGEKREKRKKRRKRKKEDDVPVCRIPSAPAISDVD